jgi:hypothetical protein
MQNENFNCRLLLAHVHFRLVCSLESVKHIPEVFGTVKSEVSLHTLRLIFLTFVNLGPISTFWLLSVYV